MDLFEYAKSKTLDQESPLASRLRPRTLDEVVGQQHIVGKDKLLYRAIKADKLTSVIFYGPPGTGKTTLAKVIANTTSASFTQINATVAGKKDMEAVVKQAQDDLGMYGKKTILFIDEIHRFNKGQQDYLLPFVEDGTIILIGATTENPYFEVNGALLSRSIIFELKSLEIPEIKELILRAVNDPERGMGSYGAVIEEDALEFLADMAGGDARSALNAIELGILTTPRDTDGKIHLTLEVASECIQKRVVRYDKNGDNHYDIISAFIKSMRGSDPDAAVYYLAKNALCRRRCEIYRKKDHDPCFRRYRKRRSPGPLRGNGSSTGSGTCGNAGVPDHSFPGSYIHGLCTQEQFCSKCHTGSHALREGEEDNRSGASAGCPLWWPRKSGSWYRI